MDSALDAVAFDILAHALGRAEHPARMASYLADEMSRLTGAECVMLIECLANGSRKGRLLSVSPEHRRAWAEQAAAPHLREWACHVGTTQTWGAQASSETAQWLAREGFAPSLALSLDVGAVHVGRMFLLGLPDQERLESVQALLEAISSVMAPALRNALLWERQEQTIREHTAELRRTSEEYQELYNGAPCGYHSLDADGLCVQINDTELEWLGYDREEVVGRMRARDLYTARSLEACPSLCARGVVHGSLKNQDMEMLRKDGTLLHALVNARTVLDLHGHQVITHTTVHDITERKQAEDALRRSNRELRAVTHCNEVLMRAEDEQALLEDICRIVCEDAGYCLAWVGYAQHDENKSVKPVAWAGANDGYLEQARITWADEEYGQGPTGVAIRTGRSSCMNDLLTNPLAAPWHERARACGLRSVIALPLLEAGSTAFGALMIYSTEPDAFTSEEFRLLEGLAGDLAFGIGVLRDRAQHHRAEEELRMASTGWNAAMDASEDIVYQLDLKRRVRRGNRSFYALTRTTPAQVLGRPIAEVLHPQCPGSPCALCQAHGDGGDRFFILEADDDANLVGRPLEVASRLVRGQDGQALSVLVTMHDLSHDRQLKEDLRASEQRYRLLFEHSPTAKWEQDFSAIKADLERLRREGVTDLAVHFDMHPESLAHCLDLARVMDVNLAALALHGATSKAELLSGLGRTYTRESLAVFREQVLCLWNGELSLIRDTVFRTLGGAPRHVTVYFSVCPGYEETCSKVLVTVVDQTERRRAEQEREKLQAQLLQTQKMESLGSLASGVAHDMNNVLGAIMGLASVHANLSLEGSLLRRGMETIISACERGGRLVKGLLGFARQELAEEKVVDLNALVTETVALLERTTLQRVRLETSLQDSLLPLRGDPSALSHALMNLCVNAVDAMPGGGILTLRTRNQGGQVVLEVQDTGSGMSAEVMERALDPFFTTKPEGKGTGLGLPLVYGTVKSHQGKLDLRSQPGAGTLVRISLPSCESEQGGKHPKNGSRPGRRALRILLVDDDDLVLAAVSQLLEMLGHRLTTSRSGEDALQRLEDGLVVDAVILDVNMPGMGGLGALPALRALRPQLPVLLATGQASLAIQEKARSMQQVFVLSKPFSLAELTRTLELS